MALYKVSGIGYQVSYQVRVISYEEATQEYFFTVNYIRLAITDC